SLKIVGAILIFVAVAVLTNLTLDYLFRSVVLVSNPHEINNTQLKEGDWVQVEKKDFYEKGDVVVACAPIENGICELAIRRVVGVPKENVYLRRSATYDLSKRDIVDESEGGQERDREEYELGDDSYFLEPIKRVESKNETHRVVKSSLILGEYRQHLSWSPKVVMTFLWDSLDFRNKGFNKKISSYEWDDLGDIIKKEVVVMKKCGLDRYGKIEKKLETSNRSVFGIEKDLGEWKEYENKVLGVRFLYPAEWGNTSVSYLTDLKKAKDAYYKEKSKKLESVRISFSRKHTLEARAFSSEYQGDNYEYGNGSSAIVGDDNNFEELSKDHDVCKYSHNFNLIEGKGVYVTDIDSVCNSQVKVVLKESVSPAYKSCNFKYLLRSLAFKKLDNGEFDNLFIEQRFIDGYSEKYIKEPLSGIDDYVKKFLDKSEYEKDLKLFNTFVGTIETFEPKDERIMEVQKEDGDNEDTLLIKKYYLLIQNHDFETAYAIKNTSMSLDEFKAMYEKVYIAKPFDFEGIGDGKYDFRVEYREDNTKPVEYHIVTKVENGKLAARSTEIINSELVVNENLRIASVTRNDYTYVIIYNNNNEIVIEKSEYFSDKKYKGTSFGSFSFIDKRFFRYSLGGWEWGAVKMYDLKKGEEVLRLLTPSAYGFTEDKSRFYACTLNHFGGEMYIDIYSVPDFKKKMDFFEVNPDLDWGNKLFVRNIECEY
ncbi:hypothetical protein ACFL08_06030, partial [Patescibacteria group bacterium]